MHSNLVAALIIALLQALQRLLRPARSTAKLMMGAAGDLISTRSELMAENALLRQQLIVLRRSVERPRLHRDDRVLLLALARLTRRWRDALHVVKPETLLRWHRDLFKILWRRKSRPRGQPRRLTPELVMLIQAMAKDNVLWAVILNERQLRRVLKEYVEIYYNPARPHQGLRQAIPAAAARSVPKLGRKVLPIPILGGLHHDYQCAA